MPLPKKRCVNHPDRAAIAVCVITKKPICAECSTRYNGVNYSKEGLEILRARRAAEQRRAGRKGRTLNLLTLLGSPLMVYLLYLAYAKAFEILTRLFETGEL
ncbi:MAG: hypothetical protein ACOC8E_00910 [Planctomycetota bacterium]